MKVKQTVNLPHDDLDWFFNEYPEGSLSAVLSLLLHGFRQIHDDTGVTPRKIIKDAVKETKEVMDAIKEKEKEREN